MIDLGRLSEDETADLARDALEQLPFDEQLALLLEFFEAEHNEVLRDELLAQLDGGGG